MGYTSGPPADMQRGSSSEAAASRNRASADHPAEGVGLSELPPELRDDRGLRAGLVARYGLELARLRFRPLAPSLDLLADYRLDDFHGHFESLIESDREYDAIVLLCGEEPEFPWEEAEGRYVIARQYLAAFRGAEADRVAPVVVDLARTADWGMIDLIDGHHRVQAAHEAGATVISAYAVSMAVPPAGPPAGHT